MQLRQTALNLSRNWQRRHGNDILIVTKQLNIDEKVVGRQRAEERRRPRGFHFESKTPVFDLVTGITVVRGIEHIDSGG